MRQRSSDLGRRAALLAVAAGLATALGAAGARLAGRGTALERARHRARGIASRFRRSSHQTHTCACGARYRVSGTDRHRVYWPADAPGDAPVLGHRCVECDAPLPGGRAVGQA
jgi:hypothetical protein